MSEYTRLYKKSKEYPICVVINKRLHHETMHNCESVVRIEHAIENVVSVIYST